MLSGGETKIPITSLNNLRVKIFIIGYKKQGESIVVLFIDNKNRERPVKYSIVIDCYKYKKKNITDEILRHYSVKTLSMLCWTHPHLDHSQDIDALIKKYCKDSTQILLPEHFYNRPEDIITINNKKLQEAVDKVFNLNRLKREAVSLVSAAAGGYSEVKSINFSGIDGDFPVSINIVTPISSILADYAKNGCRNINKNELSISIIININEYYLYFGGDAINVHIDKINPSYLEKCRFVKIPHHSSNTSNQLLNYLPRKIDTACTTIFSTHNLPNTNILNTYCSIGDVFATGEKSNIKNKYEYGIIEYEYDFSKTEIDIDIHLYKNAIHINHDG